MDKKKVRESTAREFRLVEVLPDLAGELEERFRKVGEERFAEQVRTLRIVERCRCGDDFCATFYTQPKPKGQYPEGHRTIDLSPGEGQLLVDVVNDTIVTVEVLFRWDVREKLMEMFP